MIVSSDWLINGWFKEQSICDFEYYYILPFREFVTSAIEKKWKNEKSLEIKYQILLALWFISRSIYDM